MNKPIPFERIDYLMLYQNLVVDYTELNQKYVALKLELDREKAQNYRLWEIINGN